MEEKLFTPKEVAEILKIKKTTVYELIKRNELKGSKIGKQIRISKEQLDNYLRDSKKENVTYLDHSNANSTINTDNTVNTDNTINTNSSINIVLQKKDQLNEQINNQINDNNNDAKMKEKQGFHKGIVICGQDMILDLLCNRLGSFIEDIPFLRSYQGSYNGLFSLYQDKVHVASAHLWDHVSGEYNKHFIPRMLPGMRYNRIHLIQRMQGFYVKEGNPKNIQSFHDLLQKNVVMINREKGSGTRVLLDEHLLKLGIFGKDIKGYDHEVKSHMAGATAVALGNVDVCIGNEHISKHVNGIEFIPIQKESIDLIIKEEETKQEWYEVMLKILRSREFQEEVKVLLGYDVLDMGKILDEL